MIKKLLIKKDNQIVQDFETSDEALEIVLQMFKNKYPRLDEIIVNADSDYDPADVMEEIPAVYEIRKIEQIDELGNITEVDEEVLVEPAKVKLRAEYTIELQDMTHEANLQLFNKFQSEKDAEAEAQMQDRLNQVTGSPADYTTHLAISQNALSIALIPGSYAEQEVQEAQAVLQAYKAAWDDIKLIREIRDLDIANKKQELGV